MAPAAPVVVAEDGGNDLSSGKLSKYALLAGLGGLAYKFLMPKIKGDGDDSASKEDAGFKAMMADKISGLTQKLESSEKM